jgi:hypothetical protein
MILDITFFHLIHWFWEKRSRWGYLNFDMQRGGKFARNYLKASWVNILDFLLKSSYPRIPLSCCWFSSGKKPLASVETWKICSKRTLKQQHSTIVLYIAEVPPSPTLFPAEVQWTNVYLRSDRYSFSRLFPLWLYDGFTATLTQILYKVYNHRPPQYSPYSSASNQQ